MVLDATGLENGLHEAILVVSSNGGAPVRVPVSLTVGGASPVGQLPEVVTLLGNHPNPFNPVTTIRFTALAGSRGSVRVYNLRGELVRTLHSGEFLARDFTWDGTDQRGKSVASGVYVVKAEAGGSEHSRKIALVR